MKKFFKILTTFIGVLIVLFIIIVIVGFITLYFVMKPDYIKKLVIRQTAAYTGRQLEMKNFQWKLFPTLKIQIDNATLSNPQSFPSQKTFLTLQHMNLSLKFLPLLHKEVQISNADIDGLTVNLIKDKTGSLNWEQSNYSSNTNAPTQNKASNDSITAPESVIIPSINIKNVNINYIDLQNNKITSIKHLNFNAKNIDTKSGTPFPFNVNLNVQQSNPSSLINMQSQGLLKTDPRSKIIGIKNMSFKMVSTDAKNQQQTFQFDHANALITAQNSAVKINPVTARLYNGQLNGNASIEMSKGTPNYTLAVTLDGLDTQALLKDLHHYQKFSGIAHVQLNLQTQGKEQAELINQLNGAGRASLKNAEFIGADIGDIYQNAVSLIESGSLKKPVDSSTQLGNLTTDFTIRNGIVATNNFVYASPIVKISGKGTANLNNQKLDAKVNIVGTKGSLENLKTHGPIIPFDVTGSFSHPLIKPELSTLLRKQLQNGIEKQLKKLPKDTKKLGDQLKNIDLKGLFN